MSKLTKLINNPKQFFIDAIKNKTKGSIQNNIAIPSKPTTKTQPKAASKPKATTKPKTTIQPSFLINKKDINIFDNYLVLHTGEKQFSVSHIKLWYPYFQQSGVNFLIVTRFIEAYNDINQAFPDATVVFAKTKNDIDTLFENFLSIKACFYPSNTGNNSHLLYQLNSKHIFIGHGDSDKSASAHKYFRAYDENWTAGQAHIDRFTNAGFSLNGLKQVKVGRPTLFDVLNNTQEHWATRLNGNINLLYLPTWEGTYKEQDYSSLSIMTPILENLINIHQLNCSIKLHPFTGKRESQFSQLEEEIKQIRPLTHSGFPSIYGHNLHLARFTEPEKISHNNINITERKINVVDKSESLSSYIQNSNIFICDISAVVSECLAANAPIFLYIPTDKTINISKSNMDYSEYCYTFSTPEELLNLLNHVISGNDYLAQNREKAMNYIINVHDTLEHKFVTELQKLGEPHVSQN